MLQESEQSELSFNAGYEQLLAEAGKDAPDLADRLPLNHIKVATSVFQPRDTDSAFLASDSPINTLAEAVRNAPDHHLEAITVWWSGKAWYVIDGHHRLAAYRRAIKKHEKLKIKSVPVQVFSGTLDEAIAEASVLNCRDNLPMRKDDKLERARKLVCLDNGWTKEQIHKATSVSIRSIANMRSKRLELSKEYSRTDMLDMSWQDAKADGSAKQVDDGWKEKQAIAWQKRLVRTFSKKFAEQPEIAARALRLYSERLQGMLVREWPEEVREVLDDEPGFLTAPEF